MRFTNITVTQRTNTGQYEHLEVVVSAAIDEDDPAHEAAEKVTNFIDWFARKPIRDAKARTMWLAVADENTTPEKRAEAEKWLAKYEKRKAEVEGM